MSARPVTIGLDVGGTKVAGGLVDASGAVVARLRRPSGVDGAADPGSSVTLTVARELLALADSRGLRVDGIGAGFPEYVDAHGRLTSREVLAWKAQPGDLLAALGRPVTIESDVRCAALAEAALGAGRDVAAVCYVTVGTGIAHALVLDGRPHRGHRGEAIAFGELEVTGTLAGAGTGPETLEAGVSGRALDAAWAAIAGDPGATAREALAAADAGDPRALPLVRRAGAAIGAGIAVLVRILDPDVVILGGGLGAAGGTWREALDATYRERTATRPDPPPIRPAALGGDAGVVGAALAHRRSASAP